MTVFDASIKLYGWFSENDSFCMESQGKKLFAIKNQEEQAAAYCALEQLKKMEMLSSSKVNDKEVWVLLKNFNTNNQSVDISPETCLNISEIINGFCELLKLDTEKANPSSIEEKDIKNLMWICSHLMEQSSKEEE